jgi:hypothetical protein
MIPLRFTLEDAERASDEWGANCGPGAIAAVMGMTLDELRPHMGDFEKKHYTNPTLMWQVLRNVGATWHLRKPIQWPNYGLARIQWEGPWTSPGVPPRVAYRHTHWVGAMRCFRREEIGVFDINAMNSGGWISLDDWMHTLVPWILEQCVPKANGNWNITHTVEIDRASIPAARSP